MTLDILLRIVRTKKIKENRILTVTWSDSEKEEKLDNDNKSKNFTTFMILAAKVTETSSKASKIEYLDESDSTIECLKEESDEENKSELQRVYDQLYKQSYKLANANVKLNKKLIKAQEEVDSLKKINEYAQAEIN